jgi:hypothetical protein
MINDLFALAQQEGPIAERARTALQITELHNKGDISDSEYQELMLDLTRLDEVSDRASSIETKTMLITAIYAVAQLA